MEVHTKVGALLTLPLARDGKQINGSAVKLNELAPIRQHRLTKKTDGKRVNNDIREK